jgi:TRAP-type C4-dicarboxylate transport system substrate-binding protein
MRRIVLILLLTTMTLQDPLGLYPIDKAGQERMQLAEIKHGRLAMTAVGGFATQEYVTQLGVVDETPFFFLPLAETMERLGMA